MLKKGRICMLFPSNQKIEDRALGALSNIIDDHQTMGRQFNEMDKEMSWDGYIWIFKDVNGNQSKANFDDKVPVQIKGHVEEEEKYINKKNITYAVALEDLEIYFNDRGVLYFQIFMSRNGRKREIFYASLFPTKLKYYLEKAKEKKNKKNINIAFARLEKDAQIFYSIVKQFSNESRKQGFGSGPLVQNAIKISDLDNTKEISASVVGAENEYEFLKRISAGDVSFYAKMEGTPFFLPIEWNENSTFYMMTKVDMPISIAGKKFYDFYKVQESSKEERRIFLSDNLEIDLCKGEVAFEPKTNLRILSNDAEFLLSMMENGKIVVGENIISCENHTISQNIKEGLRFFIEIDNILKKIGIEYLKSYNEISHETIRRFADLVSMQDGKKNHLLKEKIHIYNLMLEDKYIPLIILKNEEKNKVEIFNAISDPRSLMSVVDKDGNYYKIPIIAHFSGNIMKNLYQYDIKAIERQMSIAEINEVTEVTMNIVGLNLIHSYDGNPENNQRLLELAEELFKKMLKKFGAKNLYMLNIIQIKKRQGLLTEKDINILQQMDCIDDNEKCGKYILLENKKKALQFLEIMSYENKQIFKEYPIYTLYTEL